MVLTRTMRKQLAATQAANIETAVSNETSLTHSRRSHIAQSGSGPQPMAREGTAVHNNAAEGSANIYTNAFSTSKRSDGTLSDNIITEDRSSSTGSTSSNTQTAQAAHVVEKKRKRNGKSPSSFHVKVPH
ncbi:uncharacterized protein FOMMEDRAFT_163206 [Fomitiporia mediterranea MF3/22]|uniref:Uncharacterized protein n=1 Tax=Fomitiporia mediterranea (strain MF3/22) TaxID=694068 RepID=R7SFI5_FOMME|nr:uncharacterized protein FOMMEDRAFT_163206 [Fomitiporia mediterranea MF3/22]EJC97468.1 hypothetical protein FOMMEDRAFT_163206 [Fomitiporia mediterranea MF3/22]